MPLPSTAATGSAVPARWYGAQADALVHRGAPMTAMSSTFGVSLGRVYDGVATAATTSRTISGLDPWPCRPWREGRRDSVQPSATGELSANKSSTIRQRPTSIKAISRHGQLLCLQHRFDPGLVSSMAFGKAYRRTGCTQLPVAEAWLKVTSVVMTPISACVHHPLNDGVSVTIPEGAVKGLDSCLLRNSVVNGVSPYRMSNYTVTGPPAAMRTDAFRCPAQKCGYAPSARVIGPPTSPSCH